MKEQRTFVEDVDEISQCVKGIFWIVYGEALLPLSHGFCRFCEVLGQVPLSWSLAYYNALLQHCTPLQNEVRRRLLERFNEEHGEALLRLAGAGYKVSDLLPERAKSHTLTNEEGMELPMLPGEEP